MTTDRRLWPANDRVAHARLAGQVSLPLSEGHRMQVAVPVADLHDKPRGTRARQLLFGNRFTVLEDHRGWAFGFAEPSGYVGYLRAALLEDAAEKTHCVATLGAHIYPRPDMKTRPKMLLPFGAMLHCGGQSGPYVDCGHGWVHRRQIEPIDTVRPDPVQVAEMFLGVPYLWGGDSPFGIDCSGLIHIAMLSSGIPCPRDSDQQADRLGDILPAEAGLRRGDTIFWSGHVGLMQDADLLIHANGYHMATVREPLARATARIAATVHGNITIRRRPGS
ncbi:MAG: C40 family peptidase [Rhodobacteraceae bacterium]|nr:C40 family peptidase [Paracoccaceae bacterium]